MSRKQPFANQQLGTLSTQQSSSFNQSSNSFRLNKTHQQPPHFINASLPGSGVGQGYINQNSQNASANINGNIIAGGRISHELQSKKENNFQKLNKQSTMLYLHHHNSQNNAIGQNSHSSALTNTLINHEKNSGSNSNSFCLVKNKFMIQLYLQISLSKVQIFSLNNHSQLDHNQSTRASTQLLAAHQQPLKEVQIQEIENRPQNLQHHHHQLQHIPIPQQHQMNDYQQFSNTATLPLMGVGTQINNHKKASKMFAKDQISTRRNSQDKMHNISSLQHNNSMIGTAPLNAGYCPQENMNKNRPQTSYRLATKNSFQIGGAVTSQSNTSLGNIPNSSSQNNLHSIQQQQQHQQLQPKILINNIAQQHNKENVGILSNTSTLPPVGVNNNSTLLMQHHQNQPTNITNFQKQLDQVSQIDFIFQDENQKPQIPKPTLTEIERENLHVTNNYGDDIDEYQRELEQYFNISNCLVKHKITPALRARMVDWMIEVLTNFKCDDQTFFLSVSLIDRYFKGKQETREVSDLHIIGVTTMFIASKYEDIYPLKMKMVFEKIAHKKLSIEKIKGLEMDILKVINYRISAPTSLDFLKVYLKQVLNIGKSGKSQNKDKKEESQNVSQSSSSQVNCESLLIEKMSLYLAKMALHDYELSGKLASLQAVGSLYVSLKICEQLKKTQIITVDIVSKLVQVSKAKEEDIIEVSQRVLYLAQNFEKAFPGLENLKKTHFVNITQLL